VIFHSYVSLPEGSGKKKHPKKSALVWSQPESHDFAQQLTLPKSRSFNLSAQQQSKTHVSQTPFKVYSASQLYLILWPQVELLPLQPLPRYGKIFLEFRS
jgi:hypothetical protein